MSKYEQTFYFSAGTWYSEKDTQVIPDDIFKDYTYFKYDQLTPYKDEPWECKKDITIKITVEIM